MTTSYPGAILITGANGGLGSVLVDYLLSHGVTNIACAYHSDCDRLREVFNSHNMDFDSHCFGADLVVESEVKALYDTVSRVRGKVWGVINVAGGSSNGVSWKLSGDEFQEVVNQNLFSSFLVSKMFIPDMRENVSGRIINFSSIVGFKGVAGASHYCAAKAGIAGLTRSLALELVNKNITVNALALGYFDGGLVYDIPVEIREQLKEEIPQHRFGKVSELGGLIRYLLSDEGAYMTGQVLHINGGLYL